MMNDRRATGYYDVGAISQHKQRGVVLFIALISLVAMTLAAIALIRSVDTSTMIAGNLAFKQAATVSADTGIEEAISWLSLNNNATLNNDSTSNGYYATGQDALDLTGNRTTSTGDDFDWSTQSKLVTDAVGDPNTDASGNEVRYVIHRLCRAAGVHTDPATGCLLASATSSTGDSMRSLRAEEVGLTGTSTLSGPYYRVTVRVRGPRSTISYIQAIIY